MLLGALRGSRAASRSRRAGRRCYRAIRRHVGGHLADVVGHLAEAARAAAARRRGPRAQRRQRPPSGAAGRCVASSARRVCGRRRRSLALRVSRQLLAERVLDLAGHRLLEGGKQRPRGDRAQPLDRLDHLVPAVLGIAAPRRTASRPARGTAGRSCARPPSSCAPSARAPRAPSAAARRARRPPRRPRSATGSAPRSGRLPAGPARRAAPRARSRLGVLPEPKRSCSSACVRTCGCSVSNGSVTARRTATRRSVTPCGVLEQPLDPLEVEPLGLQLGDQAQPARGARGRSSRCGRAPRAAGSSPRAWCSRMLRTDIPLLRARARRS